MAFPNSKKNLWSWVLAFIASVGLALYFSKGIMALHPTHFLVLALAGGGCAIGAIIILLFRDSLQNLFFGKRIILFGIFELIQAVFAFSVAHFLFNLSTSTALAYSVGALLGFCALWILDCHYSESLSSLALTILLAGGLVIALRLEGVWSGLLYSLALLNSVWLGSRVLEKESSKLEIWFRGIFLVGLLAVGRAVIQYYLLKTNYATIGVVITHPYTYLGLFAGFFLPVLFWFAQRERMLPSFALLIGLGILFPLMLGVFIHVRPMAGFLLGLVTSSFIFGMLFPETDLVGLVAYLNLATVGLALSFFTRFTNLNRMVRMEVLAGVFIVALVVVLLLQFRQKAIS